MTYGWTGNVLKVNLTSGALANEPLDAKTAEQFIGSRGINSYLAYRYIKPGTDPLGPENVLIFGVGPLTGTLAPASGRWTVTAKSPMTGILGDANAGGHWAPELKYAGFDHIVIEGRAQRPVYLFISDGRGEIRDASHLWGKDTWETTELIREELGDPEVKVACIGPAGENLVKFACVISERTRAAGRTGMGAVMGSKNLKAIAVRGTGPVQIARPQEFGEAALKIHRTLRYDWPAYEGMSTQGTAGLVAAGLAIGWLPVRYFRSTVFPPDAVSGETLVKKYKVQSVGCFGCPVHCSHYYAVREGAYRGTTGEGPEYETIVAVGPKCGIGELDAILYMTNLVNRYGLDSIDTGNAIAILMDLKERGFISDRDADGLDLTWGRTETAIALIHKIARREGIGDLLAEGSLKTAQKYGPAAEAGVWHIKGLGNISVEMRALKGANLGYATSTRGLDHLRGMCVPEEVQLPPEAGEALYGIPEIGDPDTYARKAEGVVWLEKFTASAGASGICLFNTAWICAPLGPRELAELLTAATGVDYSEDRIFKAGARIYNLERAFLAREGITRADDYPPAIVFEQPIPDGARKGAVIDRAKYDEELDDYYRRMGWDTATGIPRRETLEALDLGYVAEELAVLGKLPEV
ncbi:MAG: aldehyde ferredoxin oxidoreductase family protein [Bacillota bacterium]